MRFIFIYAVPIIYILLYYCIRAILLAMGDLARRVNRCAPDALEGNAILALLFEGKLPLHHTKYGILGSAVANTPGVFQNSGIEGQSAHVNRVLHVLRGKSTPLLPRAEVQNMWSNTSYCRTSCLSALRRTCHARRTTVRAKVRSPLLTHRP